MYFNRHNGERGGLFYTGSLRKAYEPALQGRDKISMRGLIKGDTEKSTPTLSVTKMDGQALQKE